MVYSGEGSVYCVAVYTVTVVTNMKCVYRQTFVFGHLSCIPFV